MMPRVVTIVILGILFLVMFAPLADASPIHRYEDFHTTRSPVILKQFSNLNLTLAGNETGRNYAVAIVFTDWSWVEAGILIGTWNLGGTVTFREPVQFVIYGAGLNATPRVEQLLIMRTVHQPLGLNYTGGQVWFLDDGEWFQLRGKNANVKYSLSFIEVVGADG